MLNNSLDYTLAEINPSDVKNDKLRRAVASVQERGKSFMFNYSDYSDYSVQYHVAQSK